MSKALKTIGRRDGLLLPLAALLLMGCSRDSGPSGERAVSAPPDDKPAVASLQVVDRAAFDQVLAEQRGKVVLVDFWATWCAPCVKQLPHTLELAAELQDEGLAVLTVCMEDPDDLERIQQFLAAKTNAAAINLLSSEGGSSPAMEAFEITGGALPHYKLYDRQLQLRQTFALDPAAEEQFTTDDIDAAVNALLQE